MEHEQKQCEQTVKHLKTALEIARDCCADNDSRSALLVTHMALTDEIMNWKKK